MDDDVNPPSPKRMKTSDDAEEEKTDFDYRKSEEYMSPVVKRSEREEGDPSYFFREICDDLMEPFDKDAEDPPIGGVFTMTNADDDDDNRDFAKLCLTLFNKAKGTRFKLVKIWKSNSLSYSDFITFSANEDGYEGQQPLFFRGVVRSVPKRKAVFCEIKENDDVTLLPGDRDCAAGSSCVEDDDTKK